MKIIDRYMLGQFVQVYLICFLSLTGLYVVIDAFGNLDEFISYSEEHGSLVSVVSRYYGYRSVAFFDRISGVLALVAAIFTVTWIQRHHELTALAAAGIPTFRVVAPVVIAAGSVAIVAAANRELVIPEMRGELSRNAQDLVSDASRDLKPRYDAATDILLRGEKLFTKEGRIRNPNFMLPPLLQQYGKHLGAKNAQFMPATSEHPAGYLFDAVHEPAELCQGPSLVLGEAPVVLTPPDYAWLAKDQCFVVCNVEPRMLEGSTAWRTYASTGDLIRGLYSPSLEFGADVRVAIHYRVVQPLLDVTLLFLGLPLVVSRANRNVFVAVGLCVLIAAGFMIVVMGCQYLGTAYLLTPAWSAWLPLALFVPAAAAMSDPLWR